MTRSFMIETFEAAGLKPWIRYIDYLRRARDQGAQQVDEFLSYHDGLSLKERKTATPEDICKGSGVPEKIVIGLIAGQLWELGYQQADFFLALQHPKIVKRAVQQALKPGGVKDRENLLKSNGIIPIPRNSSVHFHKHVSGGSAARGDKDNAPPPAILPSFEDDLDYDDEVPQLPPGR